MQFGFFWREGVVGGVNVRGIGNRGSGLGINDLWMPSIGRIRCPIFGTIGGGDWEGCVEWFDERA